MQIGTYGNPLIARSVFVTPEPYSVMKSPVKR